MEEQQPRIALDPSRVPKVFGWISILFGLPWALVLLLLLAGPAFSSNVTFAVSYGKVEVNQVKGPLGISYYVEVGGRRARVDPRKAAATIALGRLLFTGHLVFALVLLIAAYGLLKYRAWARRLVLYWAFFALCFTLTHALAIFPELSLRMRELLEPALGGRFQLAKALATVSPTTIALTTLGMALYPALLLFFFVLPHTKASMR